MLFNVHISCSGNVGEKSLGYTRYQSETSVNVGVDSPQSQWNINQQKDTVKAQSWLVLTDMLIKIRISSKGKYKRYLPIFYHSNHWNKFFTWLYIRPTLKEHFTGNTSHWIMYEYTLTLFAFLIWKVINKGSEQRCVPSKLGQQECDSQVRMSLLPFMQVETLWGVAL